MKMKNLYVLLLIILLKVSALPTQKQNGQISVLIFPIENGNTEITGCRLEQLNNERVIVGILSENIMTYMIKNFQENKIFYNTTKSENNFFPPFYNNSHVLSFDINLNNRNGIMRFKEMKYAIQSFGNLLFKHKNELLEMVRHSKNVSNKLEQHTNPENMYPQFLEECNIDTIKLSSHIKVQFNLRWYKMLEKNYTLLVMSLYQNCNNFSECNENTSSSISKMTNYTGTSISVNTLNYDLFSEITEIEKSNDLSHAFIFNTTLQERKDWNSTYANEKTESSKDETSSSAMVQKNRNGMKTTEIATEDYEKYKSTEQLFTAMHTGVHEFHNEHNFSTLLVRPLDENCNNFSECNENTSSSISKVTIDTDTSISVNTPNYDLFSEITEIEKLKDLSSAFVFNTTLQERKNWNSTSENEKNESSKYKSSSNTMVQRNGNDMKTIEIAEDYERYNSTEQLLTAMHTGDHKFYNGHNFSWIPKNFGVSNEADNFLERTGRMDEIFPYLSEFVKNMIAINSDVSERNVTMNHENITRSISKVTNNTGATVTLNTPNYDLFSEIEKVNNLSHAFIFNTTLQERKDWNSTSENEKTESSKNATSSNTMVQRNRNNMKSTETAAEDYEKYNSTEQLLTARHTGFHEYHNVYNASKITKNFGVSHEADKGKKEDDNFLERTERINESFFYLFEFVKNMIALNSDVSERNVRMNHVLKKDLGLSEHNIRISEHSNDSNATSFPQNMSSASDIKESNYGTLLNTQYLKYFNIFKYVSKRKTIIGTNDSSDQQDKILAMKNENYSKLYYNTSNIFSINPMMHGNDFRDTLQRNTMTVSRNESLWDFFFKFARGLHESEHMNDFSEIKDMPPFF